MAVALVMAAMVVASGMPAFADPGKNPGHYTTSTSCDPITLACSTQSTGSGNIGSPGSGDGGGGGHYSSTSTTDNSSSTLTNSQQGGRGGPGGGSGRNCTYTSVINGDGTSTYTPGVENGNGC
jgi:hypothetical protein